MRCWPATNEPAATGWLCTCLSAASDVPRPRGATTSSTPSNSPDTLTPLHLDTQYEERLFVLEGACTVWVGPDTVRVGPGDYCAIPLNTPHAIKAGPDGCQLQ